MDMKRRWVRMSLFHAFSLILALFLFVIRQRCAWPSIASDKRRSVRQQAIESDSQAQSLQNQIVHCAQNSLIDPKRDPEIEVDNEEIRFYPMG